MTEVSDPLQVSLSVVGALECVVRRCVGPSGGTVIFTKDTGETLITKHGHRILTALHLEHPIARLVLECLCAHDRVTADGSKSFILLLAALLRGIRDSVRECAHARRRHASWKLANQLHAFCWNGLDDVIAEGVVPYASSLFSLGGCEPEGGVLAALVGGYISGRVSPGQAEVLTPLLCELYTKVTHGDTDSVALSFIHSNFSQMHAAVSGLHSTQSCVVEGLLLACDWSVWKETDGPVKALVVFEKVDTHYDERVSIEFEEDWRFQSDSIIQKRLARILGLQVNVVLSAVKQPDCVLMWAWLNAVSVLDCCDPRQLELLCELSEAETLAVQPLARVGTLTHCRRFQLGGHRYANIGVTHTSLHPHTLVLCAPAAGALEQSVSTSRGVFAMLQHLSQSRRHNNVSPRPYEQHLTSPQCPTSPQCLMSQQCPASPQHPMSSQCLTSPQCPTSPQCLMSQQCPASPQRPMSSQCLTSPQCLMSQQCPASPQHPMSSQCLTSPQCPTSPQCLMSQQCPASSQRPMSSQCLTSPQCLMSQQCPASPQRPMSSQCLTSPQCLMSQQCPSSQCLTSPQCPTSPQCLTSSQLHSSCPNLCQCILNAGDVVPVGGAFEFLLHHFLLHSNHGDPDSRRLLAETVLSVPRCLHAHRSGDFLRHRVHFTNRLLQQRLIREQGSGSEFTWGLGADGSGRVCVEPLCSKHQLVASVLQCVYRLLRVEAVIHTPRSLALAALHDTDTDTEAEEEDDEDDDEDEDRM